MEKKEILSIEEAQELLKRLEQFYKEPVLPLHNFCHAIELWKDCIVKNNTDTTLKRGEWGQGHKYFKFLNQMRNDIRKSNLLGRLLYAEEPLRTRMCPLHRGHYNVEAMCSKKALICAMEQGGSGNARKMVDIRATQRHLNITNHTTVLGPLFPQAKKSFTKATNNPQCNPVASWRPSRPPGGPARTERVSSRTRLD